MQGTSKTGNSTWLRRLANVADRAACALRAMPSQCAVCHAWPAQRICHACLVRLCSTRSRCRTCAIAVPAEVAQCGACLVDGTPLDHCVAAVDYAFPWSQLVAQFKFQPDPAWAAPLAAILRNAPHAQHLLDGADIILPVPLSRERLAERGFNQALQLARHLGARHKLHAHVLQRVGHAHAQAQVGLPRAQRLRNQRGAFMLHPDRASAVHNRRVLLIDDVMTTGATLHAAADVLRHAGASAVSALVLARTE